MSSPSGLLSSVKSLVVGDNEASSIGTNTSRNEGSISNLAIEAASSQSDVAFVWKMLADSWHATTNPDGYCVLGVAENDLMHDTLRDYINDNFKLESRDLTYGEGPQGSSRLRSAMAHFLNRHFQPVRVVTKDHIVLTNGCSSAIEHCSMMLTNPGDGVLLGQPYYNTFIPDLGFRPKAKVIKVTFGDDIDPLSVHAVDRYERACKEAEASGTKVKVLVLCNPHNPLGRCYTREAIIAYMKLCQKYGLHLISDEIYAMSVFKNKTTSNVPYVDFVSALSIDLTGIIEPGLVHVIWGMSKDFGANGIRLGAIISQNNPKFTAAVRSVALYSYSSSLLDGIITKLLEDDDFTDAYIEGNREKLSQTYSFVVDHLNKNGIEYSAGVNAAFFIWLNLGKEYRNRHPEIVLENSTATIMANLLNRRVFIASGENFGSEQPGWFRLVFTQHDETLVEGLKRMLAALDD